MRWLEVRRRALVVLLLPLSACRATTTGATAPASAAQAEAEAASYPAPSGTLGVLGPDKLLERLMDEMERDPRFIAAGDRVWKRLEEDPGLIQRGTALLERVTASREFEELITRQVAAGKTPEQVGQDLEQQMTKAFDDPAVDGAIDQGIDALMERPKVGRSASFWAAVLVKETGINQTLAQVFLSPAWRRKWEGILGVQPSPAMLFQRIDAYLMSPDGAWAAQIIGDALARDPLAKEIFLRALESPALTAIAIDLSRTLLDDARFQDQVTTLLLTVMTGRSPRDIAAGVRATLSDVPAVEEAIASSFVKLAASRPLTQEMGVQIRRLVLNLRDRQYVLDALIPSQRAQAGPRLQRTVY